MARVVVVIIRSTGRIFSRPSMMESSPAPEGPEIIKIFFIIRTKTPWPRKGTGRFVLWGERRACGFSLFGLCFFLFGLFRLLGSRDSLVFVCLYREQTHTMALGFNRENFPLVALLFLEDIFDFFPGVYFLEFADM